MTHLLPQPRTTLRSSARIHRHLFQQYRVPPSVVVPANGRGIPGNGIEENVRSVIVVHHQKIQTQGSMQHRDQCLSFSYG